MGGKQQLVGWLCEQEHPGLRALRGRVAQLREWDGGD